MLLDLEPATRPPFTMGPVLPITIDDCLRAWLLVAPLMGTGAAGWLAWPFTGEADTGLPF
jgi:hypothetical protein